MPFGKLLLSTAVAASLVAAPVAGSAFAGSDLAAGVQTTTGASILPTSPFYGGALFLEKLELVFTMNASAKARLLLTFARERAAEAADMMASGHATLAVGPMQAYGQDMTEARSLLSSHLSARIALDLLRAQLAGKAMADLAAGTDLSSLAQADVTEANQTARASGIGNAAIAAALAQATGVSQATLLSMRASGMGWGRIAAKEGLNLGLVLSRDARASAGSGLATGGTSSPEASDQGSPGMKANGSASAGATGASRGHAHARGGLGSFVHLGF